MCILILASRGSDITQPPSDDDQIAVPYSVQPANNSSQPAVGYGSSFDK